MMRAKPPHGAPCNNCGGCCRDQLCPLGRHVFRRGGGNCAALTDDNLCGLVVSPERFVPNLAAQHGRDALSRGAALLVGAGYGCDALLEDEAYDATFGAYVRAEAEKRRLEIDIAAKIWGVQ